MLKYLFCHVLRNQINRDTAIDCDVDGIITFMGTSDLHLKHKIKMTREEILNVCMSSIEHAKDHGLFVAFSAEDATRTDLDFLKQLYKKADTYGVDRVHIADTVGAISPYGMDYLVKQIRPVVKAEIALHCHNDFGMALTNSIAGLLAGANAVSTTVNGIGERAGNCSLEELIMTLKIIYDVDLEFNLDKFYELSKLVESLTQVKIPDNKPIVGKNIFPTRIRNTCRCSYRRTINIRTIPPRDGRSTQKNSTWKTFWM